MKQRPVDVGSASPPHPGIVPSNRVIILGAGQGIQGRHPTALTILESGCRLLDWLLFAFDELDGRQVVFVGGYRFASVINEFPNLQFIANEHWQTTGPVGSLALAPLASGCATYITYCDIVFRGNIVSRLSAESADIVVAIDRQWRERYSARGPEDLLAAEKVSLKGTMPVRFGSDIPGNEADAELVGVVKLSPRAVETATSFFANARVPMESSLPELLNELLHESLSLAAVDVNGEWAELNAPQDVSRFVLGTKAESLERLRPLVRLSCIEPVVKFTQQEWIANCERILDEIQRESGMNPVIVRSSALSEDGWFSSNAGAFESVPNIESNSRGSLTAAIERVFQSYGRFEPDNQVLVQPMLSGVRLSGVVMTRSPATGSAYYVINYDEGSRTDTITSGECPGAQTVFIHRSAAVDHPLALQFRSVLDAVREVERLVGHDSLDIEFAITGDDVLHVLQVRPIGNIQVRRQIADATVDLALGEAVRHFEERQQTSPFLVGDRTAFNVMSDWNPAEIIGLKPRRLAFSLYRLLITDEVWARQRAEYGYRDVRPCNLLADFCGHPYVDLRSDFNSFIPAAIPDDLAGRLVNFYLNELEAHPERHDKIEFDVVYTCWTFNLRERFSRLREAGFILTELDQLEQSLHATTCRGLGRCRPDMKHLETIEHRYPQIRDARLPPLEKAYLLLEEIRLHAAVTFAHLARNAFVAVSLLRSLEEVEATTPDQTEGLLSSVQTVSTQLQRDAASVAANSLPWEEFVEKYSHLRPGTYEITSLCYGQAPEEYLQPLIKSQPLGVFDDSVWDEATRRRIDALLKRTGLGVDADCFEEFCRQAIEGREFAKFVFTRHLSLALECLVEFGAQHKVTREQLSHVGIEDLLAFRNSGCVSVADRLARLAEEGLEAHRCTQSLCLPDQIFSANDLSAFRQGATVPNFVTSKTVQGPVLLLAPGEVPCRDVSGRIVMIANADPGYDWLFSRDILGLVTMYGGINSHIAVRAAEFGLPAAVGIGEAVFRRLSGCEVLLLDCAGRRIQPVRENEQGRAAA